MKTTEIPKPPGILNMLRYVTTRTILSAVEARTAYPNPRVDLTRPAATLTRPSRAQPLAVNAHRTPPKQPASLNRRMPEPMPKGLEPLHCWHSTPQCARLGTLGAIGTVEAQSLEHGGARPSGSLGGSDYRTPADGGDLKNRFSRVGMAGGEVSPFFAHTPKGGLYGSP